MEPLTFTRTEIEIEGGRRAYIYTFDESKEAVKSDTSEEPPVLNLTEEPS